MYYNFSLLYTYFIAYLSILDEKVDEISTLDTEEMDSEFMSDVNALLNQTQKL